MKELYELGDDGLCPDAVAFSNLINVFMNCKNYDRAEDILWEMVNDFLLGNAKCKPRIRNLNTILVAYTKSLSPQAPEQAQGIVERWLRLNKTTRMDVKPDEYTYALLLKCW
jgi:hypothetical protein